MSIFIGIDSGTQSTKGVAFDVELNRIVAEARAPHSMIGGLPPGHLEQHPRDWIGALDRVFRRLVKSVDRSRVRGIGISGQQHGFVPLDKDGEVIRPAKLWCDTSTAAECDLLTRRLGGEKAVLRLLGNRFLPGYTAPKILWLKRREPANFRRLRRVLLPHDYLNMYLTGQVTMEPGDASGTALLDVRRRVWSDEACAAVDRRLRECLPDLTPSSSPAGILRPELARRLGLSGDIMVSAGGGDNMMGAIGTGNVKPGVVTASVGTSGTIYAFSSRPAVDPRGEIAAFCSSTGGWLPLACVMNATTVTEGVRKLFRWDHSRFDREAAAVPPGSGGLLLLPHLEGERTPSFPEGTGVWAGLGRANLRPANLARSAMEGVAMGMNYGLNRLKALGVRPKEIRLTGGGMKSPVWRQIMADVFGVPVVGMRIPEGAALGAALQAAWCVEVRDTPRARIGDLTAAAVEIDEKTRSLPRRKFRDRYRELQDLQDRLGPVLADTSSRLRRLPRA